MWRREKKTTIEYKHYNNLIISSDCYALHSQHFYGQIYIRCWNSILNCSLNIIIIRQTIPFCHYHYNNIYLRLLQLVSSLYIFIRSIFILIFILSHINVTSDNVTMFKLLNFPHFFLFFFAFFFVTNLGST